MATKLMQDGDNFFWSYLDFPARALTVAAVALLTTKKTKNVSYLWSTRVENIFQMTFDNESFTYFSRKKFKKIKIFTIQY